MVFYHGREVINTGEDKRISRACLSANPAKPVGSMFTERPCLKKMRWWRETEEDTQHWPLISAYAYAHTYAYTTHTWCLQTLPRVPWSKSHSELRTSPNISPHPLHLHLQHPTVRGLSWPFYTVPYPCFPCIFIYHMLLWSMYLFLFSIACSNMRVEATINTI